MNKPALGMLVGAILGALDGLSAWLSPEARPMMVTIVVGSTVKGIVTGALAGLIARRRQSLTLGVVAGVVIGFVLSSLVAIGQAGHYMEIVLPGMLVGALVGFVTQRYPPTARDTGSSRVARVVLALAFMPALALAQAQSAPQSDPLAPLSALVGQWKGTTEGKPGSGNVEREYTRILGSRFVHVRNRSTYPPQEKNPKGEVHEDAGVFSFDRARRRIVFRQFHSEGFVNQYVLDPESKPDRLVMTTEAIENIPVGWRARETYVLTGSDQLEEIFELAEPGKDFEVYSRNRLRRVP